MNSFLELGDGNLTAKSRKIQMPGEEGDVEVTNYNKAKLFGGNTNLLSEFLCFQQNLQRKETKVLLSVENCKKNNMKKNRERVSDSSVSVCVCLLIT